MNVSIDVARLNLARSFNDLVESIRLDGSIQVFEDELLSLRQDVGLLLCIYNDKTDGDFNSLADTELQKIQ